MNKIYLTLILICFAKNIIISQISPFVLKNFPAHIILEIDELNSTLSINELQQTQIANKLLTYDSIANAGKLKIKPNDLDYYYRIHKETLDGIISEEDMALFLYQKDPNNRFLLAITMRDQLRLTDLQVNEIRKENETLKTLTNITNIHAYCKSKLDSILTIKQTADLTKKLYKEETIEAAKKDWESIRKLNIVDKKDALTAYKLLKDFHNNLNELLDLKAEKYSQNIYERLKTILTLEKQPNFLLHKKILVNDRYHKNIFAIAVKNEKVLELTKPQIDSLLEKCKALEILKFKNRNLSSVGIFPFEQEHLPKILDNKKMTKLLIIKHSHEAKFYAKNSWEEVKKFNWTDGLDEKETTKTFKNYKHRMLVITDQIKRDKNQKNLFLRRDIELKKPELLKKLDSIIKTEQNNARTKNQLKW